MNFKIKPFSEKSKTEASLFNQTLIPVDIIGLDFKATIAGVPRTMTLNEICTPFNINPNDKNILVNGLRVNDNLEAYIGDFIDGCIIPKVTICITDLLEEEVEEECDIDELLEENSLLVLENESLKDEIMSLRIELERVTKLKDTLLQAITEASAVLTAPFAKFFIDNGESK